MNEWIDFAVFAAQAIIMWIVVPRHAARFTRPMLFDRNPAWAAANPDLVAKFERGGWWFKVLPAWAIVTVVVLLMIRVGWPLPFLPLHSPGMAGWEILTNTNNWLMTLGFVLFGVGAWRNFRWLKHTVPLAETRQASLIPRRIDDFVPRWFQYAVYALMVLNVIASPVLELLYPGRLQNVLAPSVLGLIMSVLLVLIAAASVARPPNHFDRAFGPSYRRLEIHVYFGIMIVLALVGLLNVVLELNGVDLRRYGAVILAASATAALVAFMLLPTSKNRGSNSGHGQAHAA